MNPWANDDSEDETDDNKTTFESVRDHVVFLIDCSPSMLEPVIQDDDDDDVEDTSDSKTRTTV